MFRAIISFPTLLILKLCSGKVEISLDSFWVLRWWKLKDFARMQFEEVGRENCFGGYVLGIKKNLGDFEIFFEFIMHFIFQIVLSKICFQKIFSSIL